MHVRAKHVHRDNALWLIYCAIALTIACIGYRRQASKRHGDSVYRSGDAARVDSSGIRSAVDVNGDSESGPAWRASAVVPDAEVGPVFYLAGPITQDIAPYVVSWLSQAKPATLIIDSPGGSMAASIAISEAVKSNGSVKCIVRRMAASGAFAIFQACAQRLVGPKAQLGTHEPQKALPFYVDRFDLLRAYWEADASSKAWNERCRARLKMTAEAYDAKVREKTWVMDAQEAVAIGAADSVIP
jgi:ATP-dependent protease ClpP protease subunit